jgi:hypothetical protein
MQETLDEKNPNINRNFVVGVDFEPSGGPKNPGR